MEVGAGGWGGGVVEVVAQQGMEGWRRKERSPGRQAGGKGGSGCRAYLFSGMRQVRYPQLRLAHLFMLNATRRESAAVSQEVQKAIFLTVCCSCRLPICWARVFFFSFLPLHLPDLGILASDKVNVLSILLSPTSVDLVTS